jgi:oxygen-independent coproporphyrinogen-3 oxidase
VPYDEGLVQPYTESAMAEIDWWAAAVGPAGLTSVYIGGGTPTVALDAVQQVLEHLRGRFRVTGDVCIETNPADVNPRMIRQLQDIGVGLVSLGVQSFKAENLTLLGRRYSPDRAGEALRLLAAGGFSSVNVDLMFALPGERSDDVVADLARAAELGATQITAYPLFTFPYTAVGEHLRIASVRMPNLRARREQYRTIHGWCGGHGFSRVSVWGFRKGAIPRYSSVTRDGYIGVGPGAGSLLPGGFSLNTFDLDAWLDATSAGLSPTALWLPFLPAMSGWWWLYWRLYETRVPVGAIDATLNSGAAKARLLLAAAERLGLVVRRGNDCELTEPGAFWIHLMQNHFALNYVNAIWTRARLDPWPDRVAI